MGTADLPPLFNQRVRQGLWLHWDGNNDPVEERNKSAAIGAGATPESLDLASLDRVAQWMLDLQAAGVPGRADRSHAARSRAASSIRPPARAVTPSAAAAVGQVTPISPRSAPTPSGCTRSRRSSPTKMNTIGTGKPWKFSHFRKTDGYANMPLDGVWLRAPYLHNGSVPTLRALLFPDERPAVFYRGYDVYDWQPVGFVSDGAEAERERRAVRHRAARQRQRRPHLRAASCRAADREALIEYLKTL